MSPSFKGFIKAMSIWADELSKQTEYKARLCELICLLQARVHEVSKTTSEETVLQSYRYKPRKQINELQIYDAK